MGVSQGPYLKQGVCDCRSAFRIAGMPQRTTLAVIVTGLPRRRSEMRPMLEVTIVTLLAGGRGSTAVGGLKEPVELLDLLARPTGLEPVFSP